MEIANNSFLTEKTVIFFTKFWVRYSEIIIAVFWDLKYQR